MRIVAEEAAAEGHSLAAIHIPKTIDNDLVGFDHTPGFPSAARFVVQAFMGANLDNSALPGVYVAVIMGRHAGFLTAASALARKYPDDGPHLIYLPEREFVVDKFLADVKSTYDKHGRCMVAVSEGVHDAGGAPIITKLADDRRAATRTATSSFPAPARSPTCCARKSSRSSASSACAATLLAICSARSPAASRTSTPARRARSARRRCSMRRSGPKAARWRSAASATTRPTIRCCRSTEVAGKTRVMEDRLINAAGNGVTPAFHDYLRPLLGSDLPRVARLGGQMVAKRTR